MKCWLKASRLYQTNFCLCLEDITYLYPFTLFIKSLCAVNICWLCMQLKHLKDLDWCHFNRSAPQCKLTYSSYLNFSGHYWNWFSLKDNVSRRPHGEWGYLYVQLGTDEISTRLWCVYLIQRSALSFNPMAVHYQPWSLARSSPAVCLKGIVI